MPIADTLITRFTADTSGLSSGAAEAAGAIQGLESSFASAGSGIAMALDIAIKATVAATTAVIAFGAASVQVAADIERLKISLKAMSSSTEEFDKTWASVKEMAKLPALGIEEAAQAMVKLRAAGIGVDDARESIVQFGNALALSGGGKEEMGRVIKGISDMAGKGSVQMEEINQMAEAIPMLRTAMKEVFGTADTEQLQKMGISVEQFVTKLTKQMAKAPRAAGGMQNSMDNLVDSMKMGMADVGNEINKSLKPVLDSLSAAIEKMVEDGTFKKLGEAMEDLVPSAQTVADAVGGIADALKFVLDNGKAMVYGLMSTLGPLGTMLIAFSEFAGKKIQADKLSERLKDSLKPLIRTKSDGVLGTTNDVETKPTPTTDNKPEKMVFEQQLGVLRTIARNTDPGAANMILGGGNLGRNGVTATELSGRSGRGGNGLERQLTFVIRNIIDEAINKAMRTA